MAVIFWAIMSLIHQTLDLDFFPFNIRDNRILLLIFAFFLLFVVIVVMLVHYWQKKSLERIDGTCLGCKNGVSFDTGYTFCRYNGESLSSNKCKKYEPIIPIKK